MIRTLTWVCRFVSSSHERLKWFDKGPSRNVNFFFTYETLSHKREWGLQKINVDHLITFWGFSLCLWYVRDFWGFTVMLVLEHVFISFNKKWLKAIYLLLIHILQHVGQTLFYLGCLRSDLNEIRHERVPLDTNDRTNTRAQLPWQRLPG